MNILTFNIVDWFQSTENRKYSNSHIWMRLPSNFEKRINDILELLDILNLKATFFILGWVADQHPQIIKQIHAAGHEIAAHSYWYHKANRLIPEDFNRDLVRSISVLSELVGQAITTHRAPDFSLRLKDQWAFDILASNGITVDSSVQIWSAKHELPIIINSGENHILEFPLIKTSLGIPYSGGGYFRAMPQALLNYLFRDENQYKLLYFHPRDFDSDNPVFNRFSAFRNYLNSYNTNICMQKLQSVLSKQPAYPLRQAADILLKNNTL